MNIRSCDLSGCNVCFLTIASAFVKKIGVVEEVDQLRGSQGDVSLGHVVLALIMDILSGRSEKAYAVVGGGKFMWYRPCPWLDTTKLFLDRGQAILID
ncbi:MAG: hypothetical protein ACLQT6_08035 [Desulfomonilaceae bacterium]